MNPRLTFVLGLVALSPMIAGPLASARPTTQPTTAPASPMSASPMSASPMSASPMSASPTHPLLAKADTAKSPTTAPSSPTATIHDLAAKIRALSDADDQQEKLPRVAYFDLNRPIVEKPADFSLFGNEPGIALHVLVQRLHHARDDKSIRAVLLTLGDPQVNLAQAQEVRDALIELRRAGKQTFVYADGYDTDTYTLASGATNICLLSGGEMELPGVGIETMYLKGLFDKLGVKADYVQIGEYKGADEEFTRTEASDEFKGELNKLMDGLYGEVVDGIAENRNLSHEQVKSAIDQSILTAEQAKDLGLIDNMVDEDGLRDLISSELGSKIDLVRDYDAPRHEDVDMSNPLALFSFMMRQRPVETGKPAVALVDADGVIVDGEGGSSLTDGATIGSDNIRRAMREAQRDANVKAVVIRINSPGGSALASEAMWQAVRRVAKNKPVIISVGNMAASGGYYLASAGDTIFADPSAIVGSIGVVGGKFVTHDLFEKLGISTESFLRGRNADLFSSEEPFSDRQRRMVTNWMRSTYDQFTQRVMTTRNGKIKDIDKVARGRVFIADQARDLGMIDQIGGVDAALSFAAKKANLPADGFDVRVVPAPRTLADIFNGGGDEESQAPVNGLSPIQPKIDLGSLPLVRSLSPQMRSMLSEELEVLTQLQRRPVVLAAPFAMRVE